MAGDGEVAAPAAPELDAAASLGLQASVKYVVCQFLEDNHYDMLAEALSTRWDRLHSLSAAMKLMEQYGVILKPEEVEKLSEMDEMQQINALVMKMPQQSNEQFQHFFLQLQLIVSTATRVRRALEEGKPEQVEEALNDAESTGIAPYILKMAIVQAGSEVSGLKRTLEAFIKECDAKMSKLIRGQEDAMTAQKKLAAAQAQLSQFTTSGNEKAKKVLMSLAGGSSSAMKASTFHGWAGYTRQMKQEASIRAEYEERIEEAERRLIEYKAQQISNIRGVLMKKVGEEQQLLIQECFKTFKDLLEEKKWNAENAAKVAELEAKIAATAASQKEGQMKLMMRMGSDNDTNITMAALQAWIQFSVEYKKDKETEDRVKAAEQEVQAFLKGKSDSAKQLLNKMSSGTDSGLVTMVWQAWVQLHEEEKQQREMEDILNNSAGRFGAFSDRNADSAKKAMSKATYHVEYMCYLRTFNAWRLEAKTEKTYGAFQGKIDAKKQQLMGVQQMFRNFAQQLESGLKDGADSGRDLRDGPPAHWRMKRNEQGSVSLPDIHAKQRGPGSGTPKQAGSGSRRGVPATPTRSPAAEDPPPQKPREAW